MKSDREFIDGIYAKAEAAKTKSVEEVQKIENTGRNSGRRIFNISAAVTAAAAVLAIFLTSAYILKNNGSNPDSSNRESKEYEEKVSEELGISIASFDANDEQTKSRQTEESGDGNSISTFSNERQYIKFEDFNSTIIYRLNAEFARKTDLNVYNIIKYISERSEK